MVGLRPGLRVRGIERLRVWRISIKENEKRQAPGRATQIVSGGKLTVWPQQDDALTLKPVSGRNYEMPSLVICPKNAVMGIVGSAPPRNAHWTAMKSGPRNFRSPNENLSQSCLGSLACRNSKRLVRRNK